MDPFGKDYSGKYGGHRPRPRTRLPVNQRGVGVRGGGAGSWFVVPLSSGLHFRPRPAEAGTTCEEESNPGSFREGIESSGFHRPPTDHETGNLPDRLCFLQPAKMSSGDPFLRERRHDYGTTTRQAFCHPAVMCPAAVKSENIEHRRGRG